MSAGLVKQISLVLTERCNFSCPYCYQSTHTGPKMGIDVVEAVAREVRSLVAPPAIHFFGGEPLLAFDTLQLAVERLKFAGVSDFSITTNGSLLTAEVAAYLRQNNFTVIVSMDGGAQAQALRQPGSYQALKRRLTLLLEAYRDRSTFVSCHAVVTAQNVKYLCDSIQSLTECGFRRIAISPVFDEQDPWPDSALSLLEEQFELLGDFCLRHLHEKGWIPLNKWDGSGKSQDSDCGCALVNGRSFSVHVNGDLSTCLAVLSSKMPTTLREGFQVGSIFTGFPDAMSAGHQCRSTLDAKTQALTLPELQRGRLDDTYGCPLSVLLASDRSQLRHQEIWKHAERKLVARLPKRRNVFALENRQTIFAFKWSGPDTQ